MENVSCQALQLLREYIDVEAGNHFLHLKVTTTGGGTIELSVPMADVARPSSILQQLAAKGWVDAIAPNARDIIRHVVGEPRTVVQVTSRTGWHDRCHFVLPHRTIGPVAENLQFLSASRVRRVDHAGSLEKWRAGLKVPSLASSYLTFASALAMAGALLEPLDENEGAIFQLTGPSSTGKTLALRVAQSAIGAADTSGILTHDITDRALEEHLASANHGLLCIDELARLHGTPNAKRERIKHLPHMLASGVGRARSRIVEAEHLERMTYRLMGLSTGELPLESYGEREAGERVRFPDIPVPPPAGNGIFDRLDGHDAAHLAAQVEETIRANYGVAYDMFIRRLVGDRDRATESAKAHIETFLAKASPDGTSWDRRFARKFAIVYAAAALASEWEILPLSVTHARNCILRLHRKARIEARTAEEAKDAVVAWLAENTTPKHFPMLKKGAPFPEGKKAIWGFRRKADGHIKLVVIPKHLKDRIRPQRHERAVLQMLVDEGLLIQQREGRFETQMEIAGLSAKRPMFFCFDLSTLPRRQIDE